MNLQAPGGAAETPALAATDLQARLAEPDRTDDPAGEAPDAWARREAAFGALAEALAFLHPREDAAAALERARRRYYSPAAFFEAPRSVLERGGIVPRDALLFSQIPALARILARSRLGPRPRLKNLSAAGEFLLTRYKGLAIEHFYLLCLDASGRLIACTLLQTGTTDSAPFYLKHVLAEVVRTRAHAVVISHNHPNFSARPSQADIACTLELLGALYPVGTLLLDHIIVSGRECVSLRGHGFVRGSLWLAQAPEDPLLGRWLDE